MSAAGAAPPRRRRALRCPPAVDALSRCGPASSSRMGSLFTTFYGLTSGQRPTVVLRY